MDLSRNPETIKALEEENLRYIPDSVPGFFRERFGHSFKYYDHEGKTIKDKKILSRISDLVIPPAWKNVWVCSNSNGHLQVTGIDEKHRKQYIYHPKWIAISQENKFGKMVDFGLSLPKIRTKIKADLSSKKLDKKKVLATVIWLLEHTFIRVGNEQYQQENNSFGLTTLRNRHVTIRGPQIVFKFVGKKGVLNIYEVSNAEIAKTIKHCCELPGYEIFHFIDEDRERHVIDSEDVNLFLKEVTNEDFSAKDFRTWGGSKLSANNFYKLGAASDKETIKKNVSETVKKVSNYLNNTVSVCRNYYIHPTVIKTYQKNILVPHFGSFEKSRGLKGLTWDEYALIKLLQKY